jgi:hypothetical protein
VALSLAPDAVLEGDALASFGGVSAAVDAGLVIAGLVAIGLALLPAMRETNSARRWIVIALLLTGLVSSADATIGLVRYAVVSGALVALLLLAIAAALVVLARSAAWPRRAAGVRRWLGGSWADADGQAASGARPWLIVAVLGAIGAVVSPHALVVLGCAVLAALGAHAAYRRAGLVGWFPLLPVVVIAVAVFEGYSLHTIAGPVGLSMSHLADVPMSPAAQVALAPALIIAAGLFAGPIVLRRWLPGSGLAIVGVALMLRAVHPLMGDMLSGWETLFMPVSVLLLWCATLADAREAAVGTGAWLVTLVAAPGAAEGAWLLAAAAALLALSRWRPGAPAVHTVTLALAAGCAAAGAAAGVAAILRHQVVYATLATVAMLPLLLSAGRREPVIYSPGSSDATASSGELHGIHPSASSI